MTTSKEPIRLRRRMTPSGRESLYLDIYIGGKRSYEYLKLYLIPERSREDKEKNRQTLQLAEAIRAKRVVEMQNKRFGFETGFAPATNLFDYTEMLIERRYSLESLGNWGNWRSYLVHLKIFCPDKTTTLGDVTPEFVQGFKDYLEFRAECQTNTKAKPGERRKLSQNAKCGYFNKLRCTMNTAFEEGLIPKNPIRGISAIKEGNPERVYLTVEEVRRLAATPCKYPGLRRAYLFSCLTGLRLSDIKKLRWSEIREENGFTRIVFKQKKTKNQEYLDISPEAANFLGERGKPDELVFSNFLYDVYMRHELRAWCLRAGVPKSPTFHSGRHTFAVMMLDLGADIYTVQKLLGHTEIRTTEIYAKILDRKKQEAVLRIPSIELPKEV